MKRKILVVISPVEALSDQKKTLPSVISDTAIVNHLLRQIKKTRPFLTGVIAGQGLRSAINSRGLQIKFLEKKKNVSLKDIVKQMVASRFEGDLILLSLEFFLTNPLILVRALRLHQRCNNNLTLMAEKIKSDSGQESEDYFVYPGLAVVRIGPDSGWLNRARPFKKSGQLDVVSLVEAAWSDEERIGFNWIKDEDKGHFITVNSISDFSRVAHFLRKQKISELEAQGVFFLSPDEVWVDPEVSIGRGTVIYPSVMIEGRTRIGQDCLIYPHCHLRDSRLGDRVKVYGSTVIEGCRIEDEAQVGPFSRLRPGTWLRRGSRVGNFVEMKKTVFGEESKAMHLSYLGDARVEDKVNVGAGTITCNYDGEKKNKTVIGKEAFIGSGTELVAPVKVGQGAYIAAGSTITKDVSDGALAIARARQVEKPGWVKRRKQEIAARKKKNLEQGK